MLLFKRSIVRMANRLARLIKAKAIVLGDSLGQVASQTIDNIQCIYNASKLPVFSPLLTYDKLEIVAVAKKIGTYEISILPHDDCCSLIATDKPWTKGKIDVLVGLEEDIMIEVTEDKNWALIEMEKINNK